MKRFMTTLFLLLISLSLWAGFEYRFDIMSLEPLHKGYLADKDSANLQINYVDIYKGFPDYIYQDGKVWNGWKWDPQRFDFADGSRMMENGSWCGQIKLGESLGLLRNTFSFDHWLSPVSFDFTFSGIIDFMMESAMADMIAYDGAYFIGGTLSVGKVFSMRAGVHHLCTHYGDAVMKSIPRGTGERDQFSVTYKYVRMNGIAIGLSITPIEGIRLYGEYNFIPKDVSSWRPVMFRPSWIDIADETNAHIPESYRARIVNFGVELSYPIFKKLGKTTLAYDCHMYEEGKIKFDRGERGKGINDYSFYYDEDSPWQTDHSIVLNQELNEYMSIEAGWHKGRSPFHTFWYIEDPEWFYFGIRYNPDPTVTVYDSARK